MNLDTEKIDMDVLALLFLTSFRERKEFPMQAWKGHDWDALDRLCEGGFIFNPKNRNKSITFTDKGLAEAQRLFESKYVKKPAPKKS